MDVSEHEKQRLQKLVALDENRTAPSFGSLQPAGNAHEIAVGTILDGKYEILSLIGSGGMGHVYKARHTSMDKMLAIKTMDKSFAFDETQRRRFLQEAKTASSLTHPHIAVAHDYGVTPAGEPYLVMDFVKGVSLTALMRDGFKLSQERYLKLFGEICDALSYAHARGIVHRDIKPSNIMLADDGANSTAVKIVDFGLCKTGITGPEREDDITRTGEICGSPRYMSPEQCLGRQLDGRADIYSLGCVMYEVLAGQPPFKGENSVETIMLHINDRPKRVSVVAPGTRIPAGLEDVVLKCLQKNPDERYQTTAQLAADLSAIAAGHKPIQARIRADKVVIGMALGILILGAAAGTLSYLLDPSRTPPRAVQAPPPSNIQNRLNIDTARKIVAQAQALEGRQRFKEAADFYSMALPVFRAANLQTAEYADLLEGYGRSLRESGRPAEAIPLYREDLKIRQLTTGSASVRDIYTLLNYGVTYSYIHDYQHSLPLLERARTLALAHKDDLPSESLPMVTIALADANHLSGQDLKARPLYEEAYGPPNNIHLPYETAAPSLVGYGWCLSVTNGTKDGLAVMNKLIALRLAEVPRNHAEMANAYKQISDLYEYSRDKAKAQQYKRLAEEASKQ